MKKEFTDVKASNKRLTNAVKAASEGFNRHESYNMTHMTYIMIIYYTKVTPSSKTLWRRSMANSMVQLKRPKEDNRLYSQFNKKCKIHKIRKMYAFMSIRTVRLVIGLDITKWRGSHWRIV